MSVRTLGVVFVVRGRLLFQGGTYVVGFSGPLQKSHGAGCSCSIPAH